MKRFKVLPKGMILLVLTPNEVEIIGWLMKKKAMESDNSYNDQGEYRRVADLFLAAESEVEEKKKEKVVKEEKQERRKESGETQTTSLKCSLEEVELIKAAMMRKARSAEYYEEQGMYRQIADKCIIMIKEAKRMGKY